MTLRTVVDIPAEMDVLSWLISSQRIRRDCGVRGGIISCVGPGCGF